MVTFYECLQEYYKRSDAIQFSNKMIKRMSNYCAYFYDNMTTSVPPVKYVESKEGEKVFTVRAYPDFFRKKIVEVICKTAKGEVDKKRSIGETVVYRSQSVLAPIIPVMENIKAGDEAREKFMARPRKRIPVKKPEYSAKPVNK